jgi:hypothetical protein
MNIRIVRRSVSALLTIAALLSIGAPAFGYSLEGPKWTLNRTVSMHLSLGGPKALADGSASFNESVEILRHPDLNLAPKAHLTFAGAESHVPQRREPGRACSRVEAGEIEFDPKLRRHGIVAC